MRDFHVPKGVYTSSLAVNGDTRGRVVDESYRRERAASLGLPAHQVEGPLRGGPADDAPRPAAGDRPAGGGVRPRRPRRPGPDDRLAPARPSPGGPHPHRLLLRPRRGCGRRPAGGHGAGEAGRVLHPRRPGPSAARGPAAGGPSWPGKRQGPLPAALVGAAPGGLGGPGPGLRPAPAARRRREAAPGSGDDPVGQRRPGPGRTGLRSPVAGRRACPTRCAPSCRTSSPLS